MGSRTQSIPWLLVFLWTTQTAGCHLIFPFDIQDEILPGSLDPTFGDKGFVLLPVNKTNLDQAKDVAVDSSGRIVVSGQLWTPSTSNDFFVARYLESGTIDKSFNNKGYIRTGTDKHDGLNGMVIDRKGRIVVGGGRYIDSKLQIELALARYTEAGTLDESFATNGIAILPHGPYEDRVTKLAVDQQDRVVFSGWTDKSTGGPHRFLASRVTEAGDKDLTFNTVGIAETAFPGESAAAWAVGLDSAGRVVTGGSVWSSGIQAHVVAVARHLADGTLDTSFGSNGEFRTGVGSEGKGRVKDLAIDASDNIFLVGRSWTTPDRLLVLKLQSDGSPDPAFGAKGVYLLDASLDSSGQSITIDATGRILAVGTAKGAGGLDDVVVVRLRPDGSPDPTLGGKGHVLIDLGREEHVRGSAIDLAGRLLITGWQGDDSTADSFVLRVCL